MTTANKITLTRIAMIPFFLYFASQPMLLHDEATQAQTMVPAFLFPTATVVALVLFCVASFTDFLDGYVARKYNQVTDFGKFVDPLADKLLVTSALVLFAEQGAFAGWMVCVILARELIITSLRVVAAAVGSGAFDSMTVSSDGSFSATNTVMFLTGTDGYPTFVYFVGWVVTLVTIYSGYDYLRKNWDIIKDGAVREK